MGPLTKGTVVLVPFPFSDLSNTKLRPAVALAHVGRQDWILCQVTSNPYGDATAVKLTDSSFEQGSLRMISYARAGKLFTANQQLFKRTVGTLTSETTGSIVTSIINLLTRN